MISLKAYGILCDLVNHGTNISADSLAEKFGGNRKRYLKPLKELRDAGYIETHKERIGRCWMTVSTLTEAGLEVVDVPSWGVPKSGLLISRNSNKYLYTNYTNSNPNTPAEPVSEEFGIIELEVKSMGYEFFESTSTDDEKTEARVKASAAKQADYEDAKAKRARTQFVSRHNISREKWSVTDVGYEFADRLHKYWQIKPWSLAKSRFVAALATARKQHATNGEIEFRMLDLFFDSISMDKYDDAEHLWRLFIKRFPEFVMPAKRSIMPDEVSEDEIAWEEKAMAKLRKHV